jgi:Ca2+-binding RTX toxin-like protein
VATSLFSKQSGSKAVSFDPDFGVFKLAAACGSRAPQGTPGNDSLKGGNRNDAIAGGDGNDVLIGGRGNDSLSGGSGNDTLSGGPGNDTLDGGPGVDLLLGGDGNDVLHDHHNADFGEAGDTLDGGRGNDTYDIRADPFQDHRPVLRDAGGIDTVLTNHDWVLGEGFENLTLFEAVSGTGNRLNNVIITTTNEPHAYRVDGRDGNDTLLGGEERDTLLGGNGNDRVSGGEGNDSLTGGAGKDDFVFDAAPGGENADAVTDFASCRDRLLLDDAAHHDIGARGRFARNDERFLAADGATSGQERDDRVIYDTSAGNLYYDADGSGAGMAQLIATFEGNPAIAATDITVI